MKIYADQSWPKNRDPKRMAYVLRLKKKPSCKDGKGIKAYCFLVSKDEVKRVTGGSLSIPTQFKLFSLWLLVISSYS